MDDDADLLGRMELESSRARQPPAPQAVAAARFTPETARRRVAETLDVLLAARDAGYAVAVLQASAAGERVYQRLGFLACGRCH